MKRIAITAWLTLMCFLLLANVHAWEVPSYVRLNGGSRIWFSVLDGDLIQPDKTKLGLSDNAGLKRDLLVWEYFGSARLENIHVFRFRAEPYTTYDRASNESYHKVSNYRTGYDLDFYMSPQALIGANADLDVMTLESQMNNVTVGANVYNYKDGETRVIPSFGFHGTFYPILEGISLRPNLSTRINWWNYDSLATWNWEVSGAVDVPLNHLWTWSVSGGYRIWHVDFKRDLDKVDMTRTGFFMESSVLF